MKVTAVICEYNPFHNGHALHLQAARTGTDADVVVCLMSGNFVQRGAPAVFDKWARAKAALRCGADAVLELPSLYAAAGAEYFATGAIATLNACGCVDYLSFGCETDSPDRLERLAAEREKDEAAVWEAVRRKMKEGVSYPKALGEKMTSNDILALEYLRALISCGSAIRPFPVKRFGAASHNDAALSDAVTSAASLRACLREEDADAMPRTALPAEAYEIFRAEIRAGRGPVLPGAFEPFLLGRLRTMTPAEIGRLPFVSEGLEYKLKKEAQEKTSLQEVTRACISRRYTESRINRILTSLMTGITAEELEAAKRTPPYIKVLGFNQTGAKFLKKLKDSAEVPFFTRTAEGLRMLNGSAGQILQKEIYATDLYVLGCPGKRCRTGGQELTRPVCAPGTEK